jgi:PKD repeat protein
MKTMKRVVILIVVLTIFLVTVPPATATASLSGVQIYPKDYIWNVPVDTLPVDPMSDTYISSSRPSYFMFISTEFPINVVDNTQAKQYLTSIEHPEFSDDVPYPIPNNPEIEDSGGDHHLLIYDKDANIEYELYQPVKDGNGKWSAFAAAKFDLSDYALRADGWPSTDAAGFAVLPAVIRYEEVDAGEINHAMIVYMYTSGNSHTWPARANGNENDPSYPPMGQRFRLKASFDTSGYSPHAKTILEAWKKYGFMLGDNSKDPRAWLIPADNDPRWGDGQALYNEMMKVHGSDFEAVDVNSLMINKNSGQARITSIVTPTPTPTKTPTPTPTPTPVPGSPTAQFTANIVKGNVPLTVKFTDRSVSSGTTSYKWNINNDGTVDSTSQNPSFTYTAAGLYTVKLVVTNSSGSDSEIKTNYINVTTVPVTATAETGVYRPNAGFYLKMDNGNSWEPSTDLHLAWDNARGDLPIAADWNGDGITETGVYRPGAGFYLKMDNTGTWKPASDLHLAWDNAPGDLPIAGDWNGDGITETGVYRPGAGFYLKMDNTGTWKPASDLHLAWDNAPGDLPIAGDWNGDGVTETGVYRPGTGFYLKMDNTGTWKPTSDLYLVWDNVNGDIPCAGNFV